MEKDTQIDAKISKSPKIRIDSTLNAYDNSPIESNKRFPSAKSLGFL